MVQSNNSQPASPAYKTRRTIIWIARIALALVFGGAGLAKIAGVDAMVAGFDAIGFGQWFRYFTGALEIALAILLVLPRWSALGAVMALGICGGALLVELQSGGDLVHVFVLGGASLALAYSQRADLAQLASASRPPA